MEQELHRGSKQWIYHVIAGRQEKDQVVLRTDDFILLPDTERVNRYGHPPPHPYATRHCKRHHVASVGGGGAYSRQPFGDGKQTLNWLAILTDPTLKTLRDLRGHHVPVLNTMLHECMEAIEKHTGIKREQVMAYVHYPPSVYQLHVHFSYPYGQYSHRDAYRVHSLQSIIGNLGIDTEYYAKTTLQLAMFRHAPHYAAIQSHQEDTGDEPLKKNDPIAWASHPGVRTTKDTGDARTREPIPVRSVQEESWRSFE
jgi:hypothetical protein